MAELRHRMPVSEFLDWVAFDRIDPIGPDRMDINAANTVTWLLTAMTGRRVRMSQVLPQWDRPPRRVLPASELVAKFRRINAMLGGVEVAARG